MALRDYEKWLNRYDDPHSPLSWRLAQVQAWLTTALDERPRPVSVISACAGDGRDIIDVLARRDDAAGVQVTLLESHPGVAELARARAWRAGLGTIDVRTCDAADTSSYAGAVPADVVILVGMLGNMSHQDVFQTVAAAPQFCRPGATLIWSRGRDRDDINAETRVAFADAGFSELEYRASDLPTRPAAGVLRYDGPQVPLASDCHLFTFWR